MIDLTERPVQPEYAGFWLRFVAVIIDRLILSIVVSIAVMPLLASFGVTPVSSHSYNIGHEENLVMAKSIISIYGVYVSVFSIVSFLYCALMESSAKQATIGKMAIGLKVTDMEGNRISFGRATGRHFGKIISAIIIFIGFIMAGFTERKQALHDIIANCLVVKK